MNLYIFKMHPKCSYRDGMILIAAENFKNAKDIIVNINNDIWNNSNPEYVKKDSSEYAKRSFLENDDEIVERFEQLDRTQYHSIWYVSMVIKDVNQKQGFLRGSYHDG